MKSFKDYLTESKKTYAFKIKVAGKLGEGFAEDLRSAVSKFSIANLSKGKSSPIQETQIDFPNLKNESVTVFDLEVHYPTTSPVLEQYIIDTCRCAKSMLRVQGANEYPEPSNNQGIVGEKHTMSMLKDLMKEKHAGEEYKGVNDAILASSSPRGTATEMPEGTSISPIGSKALKGK